MTSDGAEELTYVSEVVSQLPGTSERPFSSGAPRFYVADKPFAHLSPDVRTLIVRVDSADWAALEGGAEDARMLKALPAAYARQKFHFAALDLRNTSREVIRAVIEDAWLVCAPKSLRRVQGSPLPNSKTGVDAGDVT
jgi:hypothetical protein